MKHFRYFRFTLDVFFRKRKKKSPYIMFIASCACTIHSFRHRVVLRSSKASKKAPRNRSFRARISYYFFLRSPISIFFIFTRVYTDRTLNCVSLFLRVSFRVKSCILLFFRNRQRFSFCAESLLYGIKVPAYLPTNTASDFLL